MPLYYKEKNKRRKIDAFPARNNRPGPIVVLLTRVGERILKGSFLAAFSELKNFPPLFIFSYLVFEAEFQGGLCSKSEFLRLVWAVDRSGHSCSVNVLKGFDKVFGRHRFGLDV